MSQDLPLPWKRRSPSWMKEMGPHKPIQAEIYRFGEPVKWSTTPVTSTAPHHHLFLKRDNFWEGIDVDLNKIGQWASTYLKKDSWLPEGWEEFLPITDSADRCCNDTLTNIKTNQQAVAFHLLTTHKKVPGCWLTPPCLSELRRKDYLNPKDWQLA